MSCVNNIFTIKALALYFFILSPGLIVASSPWYHNSNNLEGWFLGGSCGINRHILNLTQENTEKYSQHSWYDFSLGISFFLSQNIFERFYCYHRVELTPLYITTPHLASRDAFLFPNMPKIALGPPQNHPIYNDLMDLLKNKPSQFINNSAYNQENNPQTPPELIFKHHCPINYHMGVIYRVWDQIFIGIGLELLSYNCYYLFLNSPIHINTQTSYGNNLMEGLDEPIFIMDSNRYFNTLNYVDLGIHFKVGQGFFSINVYFNPLFLSTLTLNINKCAATITPENNLNKPYPLINPIGVDSDLGFFNQKICLNYHWQL